MTLTDTHCHLDFNKFDEDREAVIQRARDAGLTRMLVPALDLESSRAGIKLAATYPEVFVAVGFHPTDAEKWDESSYDHLKTLIATGNVTRSEAKSLEVPGDSSVAPLPHTVGAASTFPDTFPSEPGAVRDGIAPTPLRGNDMINKIVAIGEIGLDYFWVKETGKQAYQREILKRQLHLSQEVNKPAIIHMREENDAWFGQASIDLLAILSEWHNEMHRQKHPLAERPGVLHSFNGTLETAQKAIELKFYIGVTGPVTYKNADEKRRILRALPLERLLIETDSPFLTPVPHRGKRNEPAFVVHIADKIAEIHNTTREQVAKITTSNAARLFGWGG